MKLTQTGGIATRPTGPSFWIARIAVMTPRMSSVTKPETVTTRLLARVSQPQRCCWLGQHTAALLRSPMLKKKRACRSNGTDDVGLPGAG
jgi:hypothetical protein